MDLTGNISSMICKRVVTTDLGEISLDSGMLNVLMLLDGEKKIEDIAGALNMSLTQIKDILQRLYSLNLITTEIQSEPVLSQNFMDELSKALSFAVGPMAEIILEDEMQSLGFDRNNIPVHNAPDLVDAIAREIPREEKMVAFQQAMIKMIKQL